MKNKIIIFVVAVAICLSIFSISCFAVDFTIEGDHAFTFAKELNFIGCTFSNVYFTFESGGTIYDGMQYSYRGYHCLSYLQLDESAYGEYNSTTVYSSDGGWIDEGFRSIILPDEYTFTDNFGTFLALNESVEESSPIFDIIYELISTYIFGSTELTGYKELTAILLSTTLCVTVFVFPFVIVFIVTKLILSAGDRLL